MAFTRKFYTSDTHFGHEGMLRFAGRGFTDIFEMDEVLIKNWNTVVGKDDIVYHLGDFSFGLNNPDRVHQIFSRLNGRKYLIIGNHDTSKDGSLHPTLEGLEWAAPPVQMMEVKDEGQRVILCHYSLRVWNACHHGSWHFFGHSHGKLQPTFRSRDVGVDCADVGFAPHTFKQLTKTMGTEEP